MKEFKLKRFIVAFLSCTLVLTLMPLPSFAQNPEAVTEEPSQMTASEEIEGDEAVSLQSTTTCNAMYRLYNKYTGEHFYTASSSEKSNLVKVGWNDEGTGWYAPKSSKTPVYRLYNKYAPGGDHHYTMNKGEYDALIKKGWSAEGVGWYSDDKKSVPLYRQYNPYAATGAHNYTTSTAERDNVVKAGWRGEGIAWYGVNHSHTWNTTHHDALTHQEAIYETVHRYICAFCGIDYTYEGDEKYEIMKRDDIFFMSIDDQYHPCWHSSIYDFRQVSGHKTVVDRQAYDEKKCTTCGAVDGNTPNGGRVWTVEIESGTVPMPDFYVEDGHKLIEDTEKYANETKWNNATWVRTEEGKNNAGKRWPYVIFAWDWFFIGYYSDKECTQEFDFNAPITHDTKIYARWQTYTNGPGTDTIGNKHYVHYRFGNTMWRYITCNGKTQRMVMVEGFGQNARFINGTKLDRASKPYDNLNVLAHINIIDYGDEEDTIIPWQEYTPDDE